MKKQFLIFIGLTLFAMSSAAQNCTNESLLQTKGILKQDAPYDSKRLSATDLAKHKKVLATIADMIKLKYTPMGVNAIFHLNYGYPVPDRPVNDYAYSIIPLNYYCDGNSMQTAHETSTYFEITANSFESEIYDTAQGDRALAEGFNVMHRQPTEKDGSWNFKETDAGLGFGMKGKTAMWLITYDGKLPYTYVTKREFLEKRKRSLLVQMQQSAASINETLNQIETKKKYKEVEYKNDSEKLKKYLQMSYTDIKIRYKKLLDGNDEKYQSTIDNINAQLKNNTEELKQQAIVKQDPNDYLSYLFTDENDPFAEILIKPNPGYFNRKIPRSSPQFFCVQVRWDHNEPIATKFKEEIMKTVDFTLLKNMLGK